MPNSADTPRVEQERQSKPKFSEYDIIVNLDTERIYSIYGVDQIRSFYLLLPISIDPSIYTEDSEENDVIPFTAGPGAMAEETNSEGFIEKSIAIVDETYQKIPEENEL